MSADSTRTVIVSGARTPFGRLQGGLSSLSAPELGGIAIRGALEKGGVPAEAVDQVIMGQVLSAGVGQMPARQASLAAGIPQRVDALSINKMCLSGMTAIALADQAIRAGFSEVVVAGGQESMSQAPHLLPKSRGGYKYGSIEVLDHMAFDGLHDVPTDQPMGALTEARNAELEITREHQDEFAAISHQRAAAAWAEGRFADEVVPVTVKGRKGDTVVDTDEGVRAESTAESMGKLRPAFAKDGTITAGSSSQISDGASAVIVTTAARAEAEGWPVLAEIVGYGTVAGPDSTLQHQPADAILDACRRADVEVESIDLFEFNEAFASVGLHSTKALGVSPDKVNVNGGAISIGHPIGVSGSRVVLTLALELARRGGGLGAAALCGGGGQGDALLIRVPATS
ncbi:acetyl-CoA C-acetyltransferase [Dietzia psychralcaliphila]|uniref:Probable acetyl-CoA acetyltransferase n=1 Tax=Dietzia psychralcaliphila TaxID=139021 RepID=A0AAD0JU30_9ACTN|nr:acetyl-CoA C-acetyltransferase [Dietzia psychralcaliphila]AWH95751.1 acetyl-CoA acetyltransferase [Dietzia psychralcaliphila]PTM88471.1 acetyl-CoA C-acetyltransferase [Dietzia psychralcaliphila]